MSGPAVRALRAGARQGRWALIGALAAAAGVAGLGAGAALAWFAVPGTGSGSGSAGVPVTVTVQAAPPSGALLPGVASPVRVVLTNPNGTGARFTAVTGATVASGDPGACPSADLTVSVALPDPLVPALTVAAHARSSAQSIAGLVTLSPTAPSTCQGVTFTVTLTLSGVST